MPMAAGRAMAGLGGLPLHRGTRAEVKASPSADEILSGDPDHEGNTWRYVFLNVWQSMDREQPVREAGAYTRPLFCSTRAVFVTETQQLLHQKVLTLS